LLFIAQVPGIVAGFAAIKVAATGLLLPLGYASALLAAFAAPGSESVDVLEHLKRAEDNVAISLEKGSKALRAADEDVADYARNVNKLLHELGKGFQIDMSKALPGEDALKTWNDIMQLGLEDATRRINETGRVFKKSLEDELAVLRQLSRENELTAEQIDRMIVLQGLLEPATRAATSAMNDQKDAVDRMRSATERLNDEVAKNIQMAVAQAGATMTGRISGAEVESEALDATRRAELQALIAKGQRGEISNEALGQAIASLNARTKQSRASLATGVAISSGQVRAAAEGVTLMSPQALAAISKAAALQAQFGGLPKMARGGRVTEGGMAIVGENGPEPVYLPKGAQVQPNGAGARTITITSNVNVQGLTIEGAAEKIARAVQQNLGRANYEASLRPAGP
ncbi:MAG: hypothetical protein Q7T33_02120, partial [Dehalococcoidia bacterium]|nr:hypothetical protein [Dehalococcoidia bacterium]